MEEKLLAGLPIIFDNKSTGDSKGDELESELYRQIGRLKVELARLKKNPRRWNQGKRSLISLELDIIMNRRRQIHIICI